MQEAELSHYVTQLKVEFDGCDSTATGFLDREQLTELCRKLQLEAQRPVLLDTLLGGRHYAQVNFEEFKTGLVAVLSRSLDSSTSEDDSSYLEPVVREEVKPKFVKGGKRYGRRSQPDAAPTGVTDSPPSRSKAAASSPGGVRRAKVRRSTSLESIESLKTEEETGSRKERLQSDFQSKGPQQELDLGVVGRDGAGGLQQLYTEVLCEVRSSSVTASAFKQDVDALLGNAELDGRDFQKVLRCSAPVSCSTPVRSADLQRPQPWHQAALEERSVRSTSPSLLAATVGQRVLGRLDEGSGCTSPERVVALWTEEGIRNGRDILQTLDFPLEERLSLADLTLALDNELLVSGNGIHQAALISYKNEVQHLQVQVEQACRERDKMKTDLDLSHQRNLQLVREVDEHHSSLETLNQSRIRDLEQDFRDRLAAVRGQAEQESEALVQQAESERRSLRGELRLLRAQEAELREELCGAKQESSRLEEDLSAAKLKLTEAQSSVSRLQRDVDQLLLDKLGVLDPTGLSHEERFSQMVRDYEVQCRELQDRNDELSSELELLKSQRSDRKSRRSAGDDGALSWAEQRRSNETNCDDVQVKTSLSPLLPKKPQPTDKTALCSLHSVSGPSVSIQTELAVEQLKTKQQQELQELHVQLETRVNYYERSLEVMRQSMEVERKDIAQAFKMEISELEEQKSQAEQEVKQLKEALGRLHPQAGGGGWIHGQERRMQRERAELEQNFAREIGNLVQRLSSEKDEMEAELKLEKDQEVMLVRSQLEEVRAENGALGQRLGALQQEVSELEDDVAKRTRKLDEMEREHERSREAEKTLHKENSRYREELLDLSARNLRLSADNGELSARLRGDQESLQMLRERLLTVSKEQEEGVSTERPPSVPQDQLTRLSALEAELSAETLKLQRLEEDKDKLLREADERNNKVEALQRALFSVEAEGEELRSQLRAVCQEKLGHAQEVSQRQRKVEELESSVRKLMRVEEELRQGLQEQQEEIHKLRVQNQELQHELAALQVQNQEQQILKTELMEAQDQVQRADAALQLDRLQHLRRLQEVQRQAGDGHREQEERLQARLQEEQGRSRQLEETLRLRAQHSSSHISMKQDQYEKAVLVLRQRTEELETTLKAVRLVLQEKVQQLKEQLAKNRKSGALLKDLHGENAQLMKALQVTEQRQKHAEKKNFLLEDRVRALNSLLREVVTAV
uniref:ninein-like protein isoform X5 n=1 Tax=Gasterosteus aculeatus aculeatus TaxID=481459 RepID=UPI001A984BE1|nr:ninein-like protein isoform X5 [Gasterosteus aculeatus aculeatus]